MERRHTQKTKVLVLTQGELQSCSAAHYLFQRERDPQTHLAWSPASSVRGTPSGTRTLDTLIKSQVL